MSALPVSLLLFFFSATNEVSRVAGTRRFPGNHPVSRYSHSVKTLWPQQLVLISCFLLSQLSLYRELLSGHQTGWGLPEDTTTPAI